MRLPETPAFGMLGQDGLTLRQTTEPPDPPEPTSGYGFTYGLVYGQNNGS